MIISRCFKFDKLEEIIEALEKENTEWSKKQLDTLMKMSPLSLKVTLKQLRYMNPNINRMGAKKDFARCFQMEYGMVQQFLVTFHC